MRDAIQHSDERLTGQGDSTILEGQYPFVMFDETEIYLGTETLEYRTLAETIRALHSAVGGPID